MAYQKYSVEQPKGVNFTREPAQLPDKIWDEAVNMAFRHGITKKVDGYAEGLGETGNGDNSEYPLSILALRDDSQNYYWWAYVSDNGTGFTMRRVLSKTQHLDATPDEPIQKDDEFRWANDSIVSVPYFTYGKPYKWNKVDKFTPYVYFPDHVKMKNIRTYKNFHIGLNFSTQDFDPNQLPSDWNDSIATETQRQEYASKFSSWSAGDYQSGVWWSADVRNADTDVSWADADPTSPSGWNLLGGAGGPIIDGKVLRDSFMIYRERAVWQMTYVGGINVFAFKEVFTDIGVLGPDCIAEVDGWHYVVGPSDIYAHNGVQKRSIADGVIRKEIFDSIDPNYIRNVFIATKYHDKEIWVCVPEVNTNIEGKCNKAFVYNWIEQSWTVKSMPDSYSSTYAIISAADNISVWNDPKFVSGVGSTWEEQEGSWNSIAFEYNPSKWGLVFSGSHPNGGALYTSTEQPINNGEDFEAVVEKRWMDMGDRSLYKTINKIYPFVRKGKVKVYVSGTSTIVEAPTWKYLGEFDPNTKMYMAGHATGRFLHLKLEIPKESRAEIRGFDVEYSISGGR